jgi:hypothetical protein
MKTFLAAAAALGLSISAAAACPMMKRDTTVSVDKELTVASIPMSEPAKDEIKEEK